MNDCIGNFSALQIQCILCSEGAALRGANWSYTHLAASRFMTESAIKSCTSTKQLVLQKLQSVPQCPANCCIGYPACMYTCKYCALALQGVT